MSQKKGKYFPESESKYMYTYKTLFEITTYSIFMRIYDKYMKIHSESTQFTNISD